MVPFYNDGLPYLRCFGDLAYTEKNIFIKIYDSDCDPDMQLLAVVAKVINPTISEELNGAYTFDFEYIIDDDKSQYMQVGNIVEVENNYFRICYTEESRNADDTLTISVSCEHIVYDLIEHELDYYTADGTATQMLETLLSDTAFTVGDVETSEVKTVSIQEKQNKKDILYAIASVFGLELKFEKFVINLVKRGSDNGVQFRYRRNIKGITRIVDGRNKIDGQPSVAYELDAVMLEQLFGDSEHFELGDTVKVYDEGLGIDVTTRIVRMRYDIEERMTANVEIANFIPNVTDTLTQIERKTITKEKVYNGVAIGPDYGLKVERSDKKVRVLANATEGIRIQKGDGTGNYTDVIFLDTEGNGNFTGKILASQFVGGSIDIGEGNFIVDNEGNVVSSSMTITGGTITITRNDNKARVVIDGVNGFKIQKGEGTGEVWEDVIYIDAEGNANFTGIITGGMIRASAEGARIEVSNNQLKHYNDSERLQGLCTNTIDNRYGDVEVYDGGELIFRVYVDTSNGAWLRQENGKPLYIGDYTGNTYCHGNWTGVIPAMTKAQAEAKTDWLTNQLVIITDMEDEDDE